MWKVGGMSGEVLRRVRGNAEETILFNQMQYLRNPMQYKILI